MKHEHCSVAARGLHQKIARALGLLLLLHPPPSLFLHLIHQIRMDVSRSVSRDVVSDVEYRASPTDGSRATCPVGILLHGRRPNRLDSPPTHRVDISPFLYMCCVTQDRSSRKNICKYLLPSQDNTKVYDIDEDAPCVSDDTDAEKMQPCKFMSLFPFSALFISHSKFQNEP